MNIWLSFFFSLLLTTLVSFAAPVIFFTLILASFALGSYFPFMDIWAQNVYEQIWNFLAVFGEGSGSIGILTIAVTCAIVGCLFEALNFYRHRIIFKSDSSWNSCKIPEMMSKIRITNK